MPYLTSTLKFPTDWYWIVAGSTTQVWSSDRATYVSASADAAYLAWLADGDVPSRIASELELTVVLLAYGLTGPATYTDPDITEITSGGTYSISATETIIFVNKTVGGAITLSLPSAASRLDSVTRIGSELLIKDAKGDAGTNNITVVRSGTDTIDGVNSVIIGADYGFVRLKPWASKGVYTIIN